MPTTTRRMEKLVKYVHHKSSLVWNNLYHLKQSSHMMCWRPKRLRFSEMVSRPHPLHWDLPFLKLQWTRMCRKNWGRKLTRHWRNLTGNLATRHFRKCITWTECLLVNLSILLPLKKMSCWNRNTADVPTGHDHEQTMHQKLPDAWFRFKTWVRNHCDRANLCPPSRPPVLAWTWSLWPGEIHWAKQKEQNTIHLHAFWGGTKNLHWWVFFLQFLATEFVSLIFRNEIRQCPDEGCLGHNHSELWGQGNWTNRIPSWVWSQLFLDPPQEWAACEVFATRIKNCLLCSVILMFDPQFIKI